jgi:ferredoxin
VENPEGRLVKRFRLAKALGSSDLLVSLPKLKTHQLMYYTGAIKNLFGLIPGLEKSAFHLRFPGRTEFAAMLADLALAARPDFALMDAVVAMEGPGPNSGRPRHLGLVLASPDALALDFTAAELIGYPPLSIPYLAALAGRGPFAASPAAVEQRGLSPDSVRPSSFELVPVPAATDFFRERMPRGLHRFVRDLTVARPRFDHRACVRCGGCVRICPAKALELRPVAGGGSRIEIDYDACIRCYCCHEVCPEDAIRLVKGPF